MKNIIFLLPLTFLFACGTETTTSDNPEKEIESVDTTATPEIDSTETEVPIAEIDLTAYNQIAFGFADLDGDSVILLDKPEGVKATDFVYGITSKGKIDIKHMASQAANENDNMRRNAYNIKNMEGELYAVQNNTAPLWETIMFCPKTFMQNRQHLMKSTPYDSRVLGSENIKTIEKDKNWKISHTQHLQSNNEGSLHFAFFKKKQDSVLVSLVWVSDEGNCYLDFPAVYNEMSTWRVDDGGVFESDYYNIIAIFKGEQGIEILTDWVGAEGSSVNYYLATGKTFTSVKSSYFYSAPL